MTLYVKYSKKYPYLPEAVADSKRELAKMIGTTLGCVKSSLSKNVSTYAVVEDEEK